MIPRVVVRLLLAATILVVPGLAYAQEAVVTGSVNVFNSPNWTISTQENNSLYGKRTAGLFRTMQLGFRVLF